MVRVELPPESSLQARTWSPIGSAPGNRFAKSIYKRNTGLSCQADVAVSRNKPVRDTMCNALDARTPVLRCVAHLWLTRQFQHKCSSPRRLNERLCVLEAGIAWRHDSRLPKVITSLCAAVQIRLRDHDHIQNVQVLTMSSSSGDPQWSTIRRSWCR